ncbi:heme oxygenase-like protein [Aureobasidium pullulans]|uniref:Heme oxygenase-like protein n=1 Tax=Aureobasidium pullulans TaxID=5580 RepID=A0A4S9XU65_AURPU|nr:heme oxygenase-like protein [Aureobasidium pullulans]
MAPKKLTEHLLAHSPDAFTSATRHPWLHLAGTSQLPTDSLLSWLTQDRLYIFSYIPFMGNMLSKTSIPTTSSRIKCLEWRVADCFINALTNVRRELGMFEDILREHFDWKEGGETATKETRAYQDMFAGAGAPSQSILVGMTALWATEKCYLEAWKYALGFKEEVPEEKKSHVLHTTLIPNWTCDEFEEFVICIGDLLDELADDIPEGSREWFKCEEVWQQVLWAEENFWPKVSNT